MNAFRVRVFLLTWALLSLFAFQTQAAGTEAKLLYEKAIRMESELKRSEQQQKSITSWKRVIDAYRSVYYRHPTSGYCDNSLFQVATLYVRMGERFDKAAYYNQACSTYQFLIEQYPSSPLMDEAMIEFIQISRMELKKEDEADRMEALLQKRNPSAAASIRKHSAATPVQPAALTSLRHYTGEEYTRIVIDFDREVVYKRNRLSDPDRLYIDFENTIASKPLVDQSFSVDDGFLKQIRVGQNTFRTARVVLDLKSIESYEVFSLYHPYRIVIDVQGKKSAPAIARRPEDQPVTPPEMAKTNTNGQYSLARQLGLKVRRIIIDPGHGGHDPGAMSAGLKEKDITLDVSVRLRKLLETEYRYEVLMTRDVDLYVPLEQRTAYANSHSADLFVSVHVNSSRNRTARGVETYYLNFATTPQAMEVAARENAIAEKNMGELQRLTTAIAMNSKIEESRDFAGLIQTHLVKHLSKEYSVNSLGVKQAPFYVLIGAQMPSVLAEISFLSNKQESSLLGQNAYRQSIAEGLARGVNQYVETLAESRLTQNRK